MMKGREMKTNAALLCLALCAGTFTTAHATQAAEGVLEKGAPYSALLAATTARFVTAGNRSNKRQTPKSLLHHSCRSAPNPFDKKFTPCPCDHHP